MRGIPEVNVREKLSLLNYGTPWITTLPQPESDAFDDDDKRHLLHLAAAVVTLSNGGGGEGTEMESDLSVDYTTLRREVGRLLGLKESPGNWLARQTALVDDLLNRGYRMFLYPSPALTGGVTRTWSFLRPRRTLTTVKPYSTGTIEIVNGVATLTGGEWPTWAASGELTVLNVTYKVVLRNSPTVITLVDNSVNADAGTGFTLAQRVYNLPAEFSGFDGPLTYRPGTAAFYGPITLVNERQIDIRRQGIWQITGRPQLAAIRPRTLDRTVGQRWELLLHPAPDNAYEFGFRMTLNPLKLDETNKYPHGGLPHAETILQACLATAEQHIDGQRGVHYGYFVEALNASIAHDKQATTPETLGYNSDPSDLHSIRDGAFADLWPSDQLVEYAGHSIFQP